MPTFNTQRSINRNIVIGTAVQATQGGATPPLGDADLTEHLETEISSYAKLTFDTESDVTFAGRGTSFATQNTETGISSMLSISGRASDWLVGWALALLFQQDPNPAAVAGDAGYFTHTYTWLDNSAAAQATTVYCEDVQDAKYKLQDVVCSMLAISGTPKGACGLKMSLMGTGRYADGAMANVPAFVARQNFYGSDAQISIGPAAGALVSMGSRVASFEMTFDGQKVAQKGCGDGLPSGFIRNGDPQNKLKLVIAADGSGDIRGYKMNRTLLQIKIAITSGGSSLTVLYPYVILPDADPGDNNKLMHYTIDLDENSILKNGANGPVIITLVNQVAAYLTAA